MTAADPFDLERCRAGSLGQLDGAPIGAGGNRALSTLDQLAEIPEEDIWLAKQKSGRRTRGLPVRC